MTEPYTPSDGDIRARHANGWLTTRKESPEIDEQFDRWLAQHDRDVAAGALREAATALEDITVTTSDEADAPWAYLRDRANHIERGE